MPRNFRETLKSMTNTICLLAVIPLVLAFYLLVTIGHERRCFSAMSQFLSLFPGTLGSYIRKSFYRITMKRCSSNCTISFGTIFSSTDTEIGSGVYIGVYCNIGKCSIGDNCLLGSSVHIMSGRRQHLFDQLDAPIQQQGGRFDKIVIGADTWIGNAALIMANIGGKCVVGAGSVVVKDVEDCMVVAGNPAKAIRVRT